MEYTEHYDNWDERNALCSTAESNGFRMLHDDFDEDWKPGDEPHGTLTFTDVPSEQAPEPEPEPGNYTHPKFTRIEAYFTYKIGHIEDFLESL